MSRGGAAFNRNLDQLKSCNFSKRFAFSASLSALGFDACCVSGVFARTNANISMVDACDAGRFSMYVSEDLKVHPCSFQGGFADGDQCRETSFGDEPLPLFPAQTNTLPSRVAAFCGGQWGCHLPIGSGSIVQSLKGAPFECHARNRKFVHGAPKQLFSTMRRASALWKTVKLCQN